MTKTQDKLERIKAFALKALMESKDENWSYIWDNPAIEEFGFYRWRFVEDEIWEGETIWLRGEVSDARLIELASSEAKLTTAEDAIWRRDLARWYATETDVCCYASLIPVSLEGEAIDGYVVFVVGQHHPYDMPALEGAFATPRRCDPPPAERRRHCLARSLARCRSQRSAAVKHMTAGFLVLPRLPKDIGVYVPQH